MMSRIAAPLLTRLAELRSRARPERARPEKARPEKARPEKARPEKARWRRCRELAAGFTLIEVVVALAVVAVTLTAIGAVAATSVRGTRSLEQHLALAQVTRIVAATLPRNSDASLDGLTGTILDFRWRISLAPFVGSGIYQTPDSPWIPQTVVVRVRSPSGAVSGFETVRLLRRPPPK